MTITIYRLPSNKSSRKVEEFFKDNHIPHVIRNMYTEPLSYEEFQTILSHTELGVEDILANGKIKRYLEQEGVDLEEISLSELYYYVHRYPNMLKAPIVLGMDKQMIGYDEKELSAFVETREERRLSIEKKLQFVRSDEDRRLANRQFIARGKVMV